MNKTTKSTSESEDVSKPEPLSEYLIMTFYRFVALPDHRELREPWLARCHELGLCGTILLAREGLNATLAGEASALAEFLAWLSADPRLAGLTPKYSRSPERPFARMKIKLKSEIVTLGQPDADPSERVGVYVPPEDWNDLISRPDVTLIDTRNTYETAIGIFTGAIDPETDSFREFPDFVRERLDPATHPKVALYCTGGIRCEKATAWMLAQGFEQVYHLEGGILKYLETVPADQSLWQGECFVFDERVAVDHRLAPGRHGMCPACGRPLPPEALGHPDYEAGVTCPACIHERSETQKAASRETLRQQKQAGQGKA